jgi:hypothetical protein
MERTEVLGMMARLGLHGMRNAYDEILSTTLKRQQQPSRMLGELLKAEIAEKQARWIRYQLRVAKLPLVKEVADFVFAETPINEGNDPKFVWPTHEEWRISDRKIYRAIPDVFSHDFGSVASVERCSLS